jgi:hypothetical protein
MKKVQLFPVVILLIAMSVCMTSCQAIGDIFKAGMGFGIFLVVAVIALVIFVVAKIFGGGSK